MDAHLQFRERNAQAKTPCIGVCDSGVGGLSVLRSLRAQLPDAPLLYVADSGHAPYGERSNEYIIDRSRWIMDHLVAEGAVGIVIACNTATAIAVPELRSSRPGIPIVGVEPGLKPAAITTRNGRIGVMATPGTIASEKFRVLMQAQGNGVTITPRPCPGLARLIEEGDLNSSQLREAIDGHTALLRAAGVDTVVLGCTHYAFVRHHIEAAMGHGVRIIDTADAVARHAVNTLGPLLPAADATDTMRLQTTGEADRLRAIASAWLPFLCTVESISTAAETLP
ncbi:MAG: glutamate racemase [Burkholderiales bacterium]|jgi:glutamate racemase|nr:glutamate racemase [Burkholderiales bacterium]